MSQKKTNPQGTTSVPTAQEDTEEASAQASPLEQELEELKKTSEEHLQGWQRAQADYQNLLKNAARDRERFEKMTTIALLTRFFPLHRNLSLALEHVPEELNGHEWTQGVVQIHKQFESLLAEYGVERINTQDSMFDPQLHEALSQEKHEGTEAGSIIREVSPGYTMQGETIVPAQVIVAE